MIILGGLWYIHKDGISLNEGAKHYLPSFTFRREQCVLCRSQQLPQCYFTHIKYFIYIRIWKWRWYKNWGQHTLNPELKKMTEDYFKCQCPPDLKSGIDGIFHIVPRDCLTTYLEIEFERNQRKAERENKK